MIKLNIGLDILLIMLNLIKNNMNKEILENIKESFSSFYKNVLSKKRYYLFLMLFLSVAYGYDLFNDSISMDDMAFKVFLTDEYFPVVLQRWGIYLLSPFINTTNYSPFINRLFALLLLAVAAILFSFLMYCVTDKKDGVLKYTILSSIFATYPLINEIWTCSAMTVNIYYNGISFYYCVVLCSLIYQQFNNKISFVPTFIAGIILAPAMSGYESVIFAYVTIVLFIIYLNYVNNKYNKFEWFFDGLRYALPLFVALLIKIIVGKGLALAFDINMSSSLSRSYWSQYGFKKALLQITYNGWYYVIRAFSYFPISEFLVAFIVFIVLVIKDSISKKPLCLLIGFGIICSLFILSVVQGDFLYYRLAQTIQVFVAMIAYMISERINIKVVSNIVLVLMIVLCLRQSINLHEYLSLNTKRSQNEEYIARTIGHKIYSEFDKEKTVIFCGEYQLGNYIEDQITVKEGSLADKIEKFIREKLDHDDSRYYNEFVYNNINSFFNKQMDAAHGQIMLKEYLSYFGYDINVLENLSEKEEDKLKGYYESIAKKENMKPYEIKDMGDYILVYLGPTIDGYVKLKY